MKFYTFVGYLMLIAAAARDFSPLMTLINEAIADGAFPGGVALIADKKDGILWHEAFGRHTYDADAREMTLNTMFDLASVSKAIAATSAVAYLWQRGHIDLDEPVDNILHGYAANGKGATTVGHLLLHNAGLPCDPIPGFYQEEFGCPETLANPEHPAMVYTCRDKIYRALLNETLKNPVGAKYVYCDECLMLIGFIVGMKAHAAGYVTEADVLDGCPVDGDGYGQCYYEAFVRKYVFENLGMPNTMFNPPEQIHWNIAPTENDTWYRHWIEQGHIHDENTYAMGGIAGHAGVFSTTTDLYTVLKAWLFAEKTNDKFINAATAKQFTTMMNKTQSSRAYGWNTNDPEAIGYGDGNMCGSLSAKTFLHTGFTGTLVCADPERDLIVVLLTNRIYTTRDNNKLDAWRPKWSTLLQQIYDGQI